MYVFVLLKERGSMEPPCDMYIEIHGTVDIHIYIYIHTYDYI